MLTSATIHPLTIPDWIERILLDEEFGVDAMLAELLAEDEVEEAIAINGRVYPRGRMPGSDEVENGVLWPAVVWAKNGNERLDTVGEAPLQKSGEYLITFAMFYPALPVGWSLADYCAYGAMALQRCLSGVRNPDAGTKGRVHSSRIISEVGPAFEGEDDQEVCEMGYLVHLHAT